MLKVIEGQGSCECEAVLAATGSQRKGENQ